MKQIKTTRLLSLMVMMLSMFSLPSWANTTYYYTKAVATAVGEGLVYASSSEASTESCTETTSSATQYDSEQTQNYYLYAKANDGNKFAGWFSSSDCSGDALSGNEAYQVSVTGTSTSDSDPTTANYYAKFVSGDDPILAFSNAHVYANLSSGTYLNPITAENISNIAYSVSNEKVATVADDGTLTLIKNGTITVRATSGDLSASYIITVIDDINAGHTQIGNGDFENWTTSTSGNNAPYNWNSFQTAEGSFSEFVSGQQVAQVEGGRPGSDGIYCADIYSRSVLSVPAQGNLTLGCINAGSTTAADAANYNYSKVSDTSKSETIDKIPTAIKLWVKFVPASTNEEYPYARISAIVHDEYNYITYGLASNDTEVNKSHAIATAEKNFKACGWTELTIPFEQTGNTTDGQMYIIVNLATNATPGQGQVGDHLYVDDIELVYSNTVEYDKYIAVAVNDEYNAPAESPIEVTYNDDSTIDFNLKNFILNDNGTEMPVGNITLENLPYDEETGAFSFDGNIQITEGAKEGITAWMGPLLGDIPAKLTGTIKDDYFYVNIDINVGYPVVVEVGDLSSATVTISDALIGTFCAPFNVQIPSDYRNVVSASTVSNIQKNGHLELEEVDNYTVPANTPVIIQTQMSATLPVSGIYQKGTPKGKYLVGTYREMSAYVGSYVLQNINGKIGFYLVSGTTTYLPTVKVNHCFLTVEGNSDVKAFFFDGDETTAIKAVDAENNDKTVYNLAGQRICRTQKGINIINGKKIIQK